jgi:ABC-2 type transport system ATP-binding protein
VCDYLVLLVAGHVVLGGEVDDLLASHHRLTGARRESMRLPSDQTLISESHAEKQTTLMVRTDQPVLDPGWTVSPITLDDLVLAYMRQARADSAAAPAGLAALR